MSIQGVVAGLLVQNSLKFLLNFGEVSPYLVKSPRHISLLLVHNTKHLMVHRRNIINVYTLLLLDPTGLQFTEGFFPNHANETKSTMLECSLSRTAGNLYKISITKLSQLVFVFCAFVSMFW